ncbi:uncharacterized protein LOC106138601 isoform X2 [Amyelois transitella]|uniref:uncharacterized protein LOC106138601 isoform X2 n=1 Tax=Amyelois transitella TaxID=680683 RepID=UPI00298FABAE|nr:uncharacterized protein LOC106138601 isoform X2 [Amyelois transitella]
MCSLKLFVFLMFVFMYLEVNAKLSDGDSSETVQEPPQHQKQPKMVETSGAGGPALMFAEELKITLERYLFGLCPQTFKMPLGKNKNATVFTCDLDTEQQDLAGRLATLALRAHSASRTDCLRFGSALANTLGELARTAANRAAMNASSSEANKKRKLSKSQKAKIQAKQRTALAVKKKAAAAAAAAAAKMAA